MIDKNNETLSVRKQCELLGIWRSNIYYKHTTRSSDTELANEIYELWHEMPFYGYRKITVGMKNKGYRVNHKKVLSFMQDMHLQALYPKPRTTIYAPENKIYPYLLKDIKVAYANKVWQTDITYIKMPEGFLYCVALIDVYSRFIVAQAYSNTLDSEFCLEMLEQAVKAHGKPEVINTDQGSQFTCKAWVQWVENNGIKVSMDGRGRWADNVYIERFWRTLKNEHIYLHEFDSVADAKKSISQYIEVYNYIRLHQSLGYKTPAVLHLKNQKTDK